MEALVKVEANDSNKWRRNDQELYKKMLVKKKANEGKFKAALYGETGQLKIKLHIE